MTNFNSSLVLQKMVFDKIEFERKGFKSDNELEYNLQVQIGKSSDEIYKVTLVLNATKQEEYDIIISLSGFFQLEGEENMNSNAAQNMITKNTVAILMPYLRSELTLLTAQPGMESVVLPPFNINKMLDN